MAKRKSKQGGPRVAGPGKKIGRPAWVAPEDKRVRCSPFLGLNTKPLAFALAEKLEMPGWGATVDKAIAELAEREGVSRPHGIFKKLRRPEPGEAKDNRIKCSTRLAQATKPLAFALAEKLDLTSWGRAVDLAIKELAEREGVTL